MRKRHKSSPHSQIGKIIRKLNISRGDVLLIKHGSPLATKENLEKLGHLFEQHYSGFNLAMVVVDSLEDIQKADEKTMNMFGWYRLPGESKYIKKEAKNDEKNS